LNVVNKKKVIMAGGTKIFTKSREREREREVEVSTG
jgi:hypothetical protein